jgi:hypothetical protein
MDTQFRHKTEWDDNDVALAHSARERDLFLQNLNTEQRWICTVVFIFKFSNDDDDDAVALQPRPGLGLPFGFHDSLY